MLSTTLLAQNYKPCSTHDVMNEYFSQNPEAKKSFEARQAMLEKQDAENSKTGNNNQSNSEKSGDPHHTQGTVYYVPVVFHILHQGGTENISDAQVKDAVRILTRDFRQLNPDTTVTIPLFKTLASDVEIEFRLATIDPNGVCTNGIIRHNTANTVWTSGSTGAYTGTSAGKWNPTKYLNIYSVKSISSGAAGYTYLPGTFAAGDGRDMIVILSNYVGSIGTGNANVSRAVTHEVGHWFNLSHTWGGTNQPGVSCTGSDFVSDTPPTDGSTTCNLSKQTCNAGVTENVQNYMDYSYCSTMFTALQATRVRNAATSTTAGRATLISSTNLINTGVTTPMICVPIANFRATQRTVCPNAIITFNDSSANAQTTTWKWNFPGGTLQSGSTVNDSMPKVSYAAAGFYTVSYTATTTGGSNSITKTSYITVNSNIASYNTTWTEGFETATLPNADWNIYSDIGFDWAITSNAAATGLKSAWIDNFANSAGNNSVMQTTSFDISTFVSPKLTFKMSHKQKATTNVDKLQIFSSTDCGSTWVSRWSRQGTLLANVTPVSTSPFTPSSSQFTSYTVNINGVAGSSNVRFRIEFFADPLGQGNNLYIDDINLFDATPLSIVQTEAQLGLDIYPNPTSGQVNVDFNLSDKHTIAVTVTDLLGRVVESIPAKQFAVGETKLTLAEKISYQPGVYLININVDGKIISKKVIKQ